MPEQQVSAVRASAATPLKGFSAETDELTQGGWDPVVQIFRDAAPDTTESSEPVAPPTPPEPDEPSPPGGAAGAPAYASLPLVALVLGVAGVVLGVTVVWFFAAIPVGIVSVAVGLIVRRRIASYDDPRALPRATIGTALGLVAILLGVTSAVFLPRLVERADRFLASVQQDVNDDVGLVNGGLSRDVNRLDRTLSRDLRRFEAQNRADLQELENRTDATMTALETRLNRDLSAASAAARRDLTELETQLREDIRAIEASLRRSDDALRDTLGGLDARITKIEKQLGL
jgi:hypothetical protein